MNIDDKKTVEDKNKQMLSVDSGNKENIEMAWDGGFKKNDILKLSEQIYEREQERERLEFQLADEEFHLKQIPMRKDRLKDRLLSHIKYYFFWIPVWGGSLNVFFISIYEFILGDATKAEELEYLIRAGGFLLSSIVLALLTIPFFKFFLIPDWKDFRFVWNSRNTKNAKTKARLENRESLQIEYEMAKSKVDIIKIRIEKLTEEIDFFSQKKRQILLDAAAGDEARATRSDIWNIKNEETNTSRFNIKEDNTVDFVELNEFYQKERSYYNSCLSDVEIRIRNVNKDIIQVYDKYENAKKLLVISIIVFVVIIILQQIFKEQGGTLLAMICSIVCSVFAVKIERTCEPAFINYWIEEEREGISEYVFRNSIVPFGRKRDELLQEKRYYEERIAISIKNQKELEGINETE